MVNYSEPLVKVKYVSFVSRVGDNVTGLLTLGENEYRLNCYVALIWLDEASDF